MSTQPSNACNRYCVFRHLPKFDERASLFPLVRRLDAQVLEFDFFYVRWKRRSWMLGHILRSFGEWYARSTWNALAPWVDERRFLREIERGPSIVHFLWAEFASPRFSGPYRRRGARLIGTFHCSARRLPSVLKGFRVASRYDYITLMSETQKPFFIEQGFPNDRMHVILHGVDSHFFTPPAVRRDDSSDRIRLLLVGDTERDHAFAADLFSKLSPDIFEVVIKTKNVNWKYYQSLDHVQLLGRLDGEQLRATYREADLLVLPLLDCTANNALLESMACGTPVMVNRIGGVPEYVSDTCNVVLDGRDLNDWADRLNELAWNRDGLTALRPKVREWAERFDWDRIVPEYEEVYERVIGE